MKSVVICGSKKYNAEVKDFCLALTMAGVRVFEPNINNPIPEDSFFHSDHVTRMIFKGLTLEHFDWIHKADVCFVYNKDNYAGVSVSLEMGYATALGKPIYALSDKTGDPCRDALIDKVVPNVEELIQMLK